MKIWVDLVTSGVKVINYSMGGDVSDPFTLPWHVLSSSIDSVYIYLLKQAGYDFILVQSAGNSDIDTHYNSMFCTIDERNCLGSDAARQSLGVMDKLQEAQRSVFTASSSWAPATPKTRMVCTPCRAVPILAAASPS